MEDARYEIASMRRFVGLSLLGCVPDATTLLQVRHLLEQHKLGKELLKEVNQHLEQAGGVASRGNDCGCDLRRDS